MAFEIISGLLYLNFWEAETDTKCKKRKIRVNLLIYQYISKVVNQAPPAAAEKLAITPSSLTTDPVI